MLLLSYNNELPVTCTLSVFAGILLLTQLRRFWYKRAAHYSLPTDEATFANYRKLIDDNPNELSKVLINQDAMLGRMGGRVNDLGSEVGDSNALTSFLPKRYVSIWLMAANTSGW